MQVLAVIESREAVDKWLADALSLEQPHFRGGARPAGGEEPLGVAGGADVGDSLRRSEASGWNLAGRPRRWSAANRILRARQVLANRLAQSPDDAGTARERRPGSDRKQWRPSAGDWRAAPAADSRGSSPADNSAAARRDRPDSPRRAFAPSPPDRRARRTAGGEPSGNPARTVHPEERRHSSKARTPSADGARAVRAPASACSVRRRAFCRPTGRPACRCRFA